MAALAWLAVLAVWLGLLQGGGLRVYTDETRGFRFTYPEAFGAPSRGTNDGFGDRVAALRFEVFSAGLGGEAALTRGRPVADLQAAGGLHDAIVLELFPEPLRRSILAALPPLTASGFCGALAREQPFDPVAAGLQGLSAEVLSTITQADGMRHVNPRVVVCRLEERTVTFHKEAALQPGAPRQHVYGAIRFLDAPYATFQIVRAGAPPEAGTLDQMTALVNSWSPL